MERKFRGEKTLIMAPTKYFVLATGAVALEKDDDKAKGAVIKTGEGDLVVKWDSRARKFLDEMDGQTVAVKATPYFKRVRIDGERVEQLQLKLVECEKAEAPAPEDDKAAGKNKKDKKAEKEGEKEEEKK